MRRQHFQSCANFVAGWRADTLRSLGHWKQASGPGRLKAFLSLLVMALKVQHGLSKMKPRPCRLPRSTFDLGPVPKRSSWSQAAAPPTAWNAEHAEQIEKEKNTMTK